MHILLNKLLKKVIDQEEKYARIICMTGSKQTHIFKRKSGKLVTGRVHGTTEIKYDIDFGIDDMEF